MPDSIGDSGRWGHACRWKSPGTPGGKFHRAVSRCASALRPQNPPPIRPDFLGDQTATRNCPARTGSKNPARPRPRQSRGAARRGGSGGRVPAVVFAEAIQRPVCPEPMAMKADGHGDGRHRLSHLQLAGQPPRLRAVPLAKNQKLEKDIQTACVSFFHGRVGWFNVGGPQAPNSCDPLILNTKDSSAARAPQDRASPYLCQLPVA